MFFFENAERYKICLANENWKKSCLVRLHEGKTGKICDMRKKDGASAFFARVKPVRMGCAVVTLADTGFLGVLWCGE